MEHQAINFHQKTNNRLIIHLGNKTLLIKTKNDNKNVNTVNSYNNEAKNGNNIMLYYINRPESYYKITTKFEQL